ncbi:hypothetical protein [Methylomonas sp. CM2]|uniref:hypothetical protein n=1 Tax=Methylomonas sp. CM2 TaxID=3417647 RepID=UPI003CF1BE42
MLNEESCIDGDICINGKSIKAKLSLYFGRDVFSIRNHARADGGPHAEFNITPDQFAGLIANGGKKDFIISTEGENIGEVYEHSGYTAVDVGSYSRKITRYSVNIKRGLLFTQVQLEGETDYLDPNSVASTIDLKLRGRYVFDFLFVVFDSDIKNVFKNPIVLAAMEAYTHGGLAK